MNRFFKKKQLLTIVLIFMFFSCKNEGAKSIIGTPITLGDIEVAQHDFPNRMNWNMAKTACSNLGNGWRLPNINELNQVYLNKKQLRDITDDGYWSSTLKSDTIVLLQYLTLGTQYASYSNLTYKARAIRSISNKKKYYSTNSN